MPTVKTPAKTPRPVYSKSEPFEAGYAAFMADVFDNNVQSLEFVETPEARMLVLAGARRLRLDKKTKLLHSECLTSAPTTAPDAWTAAGFPIASFWAPRAELANAIQNAWRQRLTWFVPAAEVCYPEPTTSKRPRYTASANDQWSAALHKASTRRLGGLDRRSKLVKRFIVLLWNFLVDRETLKLCHAYFGRKARLEDYNFTVRRRADLAARFAETPNLAPVIGTFIKSSPKLKSGRSRIPQDALSQARAHVFAVPANQDALTPAGWRVLASLTPASVAKLWLAAGWRSSEPGPELIPLLNLVSKTGERPPLTLLVRLLEELRWVGHRLPPENLADAQESLVRFVRLAAQQALVAKKKGRLKRFVSGDLLLALDWLRRECAPCLAKVQKNATWASIMRAQHTWHAELAERERIQREADAQAHREYLAKRDATTWSSALPVCEVMGASVTPLVSGKELREEGERMGHCVGAYVDVCNRGSSRIFAIRHHNEEATLELVDTGKNAWRIRQVFGPANEEVSQPVASIAKTVAKMYQAAARESRVLGKRAA